MGICDSDQASCPLLTLKLITAGRHTSLPPSPWKSETQGRAPHSSCCTVAEGAGQAIPAAVAGAATLATAAGAAAATGAAASVAAAPCSCISQACARVSPGLPAVEAATLLAAASHGLGALSTSRGAPSICNANVHTVTCNVHTVCSYAAYWRATAGPWPCSWTPMDSTSACSVRFA